MNELQRLIMFLKSRFTISARFTATCLGIAPGLRTTSSWTNGAASCPASATT